MNRMAEALRAQDAQPLRLRFGTVTGTSPLRVNIDGQLVRAVTIATVSAGQKVAVLIAPGMTLVLGNLRPVVMEEET